MAAAVDSEVILTKKPHQARKSNPASVILATSYLAEDDSHPKTHTYEIGVDEAGRGP